MSKEKTSRLIIKNLPKYLSEQRLRDIFSQKGEVTDVKIMRTPKGESRKFGFVGYKTIKDATSARAYFNNSFIDTSRITVEFALSYGSEKIPRAWSKYSKGSSAYARINKPNNEIKSDSSNEGNENTKETNSSQAKENLKRKFDELEDLKNDPQFQEFLSVTKKKPKFWADDETFVSTAQSNEQIIEEGNSTVIVKMVPNRRPGGEGQFVKRTHVVYDEDNNESSASDSEYQELPIHSSRQDAESDLTLVSSTQLITTENKNDIVNDPNVSHLDYLKSKMRKIDIEKLEVEKEDDKNSDNNEEKRIKSNLTDSVSDNSTNSTTRDNETDRNEKDMTSEEPSKIEDDVMDVGETGRLLLRNLAYTVTEDDLYKLFSKYGEISEIHIPINKETKKPRGIAFVLFMMPQDAAKAYEALDGSIFQGRLLHILPAKPPKVKEIPTDTLSQLRRSEFQKKKEQKMHQLSTQDFNWNSLFIRSDTVAAAIANQYNITKGEIFDPESKNVAVRLALAETQIINKTKKYLEKEGVSLEALKGHYNKNIERSKTAMLIKNIPYETTVDDLRTIFSPFGELKKVVLPPTRAIALLEFTQINDAKKAFRSLAYKQFKGVPLFLEWAPIGIFDGRPKSSDVDEDETSNSDSEMSAQRQANDTDTIKESKDHKENAENEKREEEEDEDEEKVQKSTTTLYVKNLNFVTTEDTLRAVFAKIGRIRSVSIAKRKVHDEIKSMGYGFVEFYSRDDALAAFKQLQGTVVDDHQLIIKFVKPKKRDDLSSRRKQAEEEVTKTGTKILVRNVPFQANKKELFEIFSAFGEIKSVRLPLKSGGRGHRGFAFVEFMTEDETKAAMESLANTHLYGRHLVLSYAKENETLADIRHKIQKVYKNLLSQK
jgi:multiple RNA-binding domain-containing protein 1